MDAILARPGSVSIVVQHLVRGWTEAFPDDELTVLLGPDSERFATPASVRVSELPASGRLGRLWSRSGAVRRAARELDVDAVLSSAPASSLLGTRQPRGLIFYDLRHELRPEQFSLRTRVARQLSWAWSMRLADGIFCISERSHADLRRRHPRLARTAVTAALGSDHALAWPRPEPGERPYALAFGHFGNKNADAVIAGWAEFVAAHPGWVLRLVGMGRADREAAQAQVDRLGSTDSVELMPWLDDDAFGACFAGAGMVVFPSDFEGFGLPAAEALRLGIPTVISDDPALAEVTGGYAVVTASTRPADLAVAMGRASELSADRLAEGQAFAEAFTWRRTAEVVRSGLR
ncbi:glycosyltransferase [Nocardioides nitrophenolicus]|uniref:glycosyltransferase n=1 Tax=Nocardioides nitrophenolicus TaxID=60489 RepID=UPI0019577137|nr:glycosyltransferase [Nocardioides nitrophenolicus]MBM7516583.1 glycosyltransferase involved in cell wall biosynthesis [Nocardioides nitrophenolicus]